MIAIEISSQNQLLPYWNSRSLNLLVFDSVVYAESSLVGFTTVELFKVEMVHIVSIRGKSSLAQSFAVSQLLSSWALVFDLIV